MSDTPGGDIWRQVTATGVNLLRFAGDVEENPGPPKTGFVSRVKGLLPFRSTNPVAYWFEAKIKANDQVIETHKSNSDCPQALFENLRACSEYEISVFVAAEGSRESKPEVRRITTDIGAPRNVTALADGPYAICVRWEHPDPQPTDYLLTVNKEDGTKHIDNMPLQRTEKSYTFTGLKEGTKYTVILGARKGTKKTFCQPVICHTGPAKVKEAQILSSTETSVTLSWGAVECDHYSLHPEEITDHTSETMLPIKADKSQEGSFEITNLKPGTPYVISIEANFKGIVSEKKCITVITKPEAPTNPVVAFNGTKMSLNWTGPMSSTQSVVYDVEFVDALRGVGFNVSAVTEDTITVHWTSNPNATPLQYVTFISCDDTVRWYQKHGTEDNERTFYDLDMGTTYTVGICKGTGNDWSDPEEEDVTTGWLSWFDPKIRVHILASDCPSGTWKKPDELPSGTSTKRFEKLDPATHYTIHVAVVGLRGTVGKPTTLTCATRPRPITSIPVTERTETAIKVKWGAASDSDVTYLAQITGKDPIPVGEPDKVIPCHENRLRHTFENLVPGKEYKVSAITVYEDAECEPYVITHSDGDWDDYEIHVETENEETEERKRIEWTCKERKEPEQIITSLVPGAWVYTIRGITESGEGKSGETVLIERTEVGQPKNPAFEATFTTLALQWDPADVLESTEGSTYYYTFTELTPGRLYVVSVVTKSGGDKRQTHWPKSRSRLA
ncbi:tenascin-N-like [Branchiostoma lanceolatum]|uniref:tenascin-N-like n=1 Tax=Branchiostoma lanceolatum TaxID=7740 RepID=UPI00345679C1